MQLTFRGSVNNWECDENNHLNVRFHVEKHWQTLCGGLAILGVEPPTTGATLVQQVAVQHIRFLSEARLAAPLSGYIGVVADAGGHLGVLTELRDSFTGGPVSACVHRLAGAAGEVTDALPPHAAPRGVSDADLPYWRLPLDEVADYGFKVIGMGFVLASECLPGEVVAHGSHRQETVDEAVEAIRDGSRIMQIHNYMARLSDGMPHLWGALTPQSDTPDEQEGGAVLEYRLRYHRPLRLGDRFVVNSGVCAVSDKIQQFAHLLFDAADGSICMSAEAVGVRMDLLARKAKTLSADRQTFMRGQLISPMTN